MRIPTILLAGAAAVLSACDTMLPPPGPAPLAPAGAATLTTANKAPYGSYVVDAAGRALYILEGTRGRPGTNRCDAACLQVWPAIRAAGPQVAGGRLNPAMIAVVPGYGGPQVSYAGWPLYYYVRDRVPSDTTGHYVRDQWGTWYLLSPSGEPIRTGGIRPY